MTIDSIKRAFKAASSSRSTSPEREPAEHPSTILNHMPLVNPSQNPSISFYRRSSFVKNWIKDEAAVANGLLLAERFRFPFKHLIQKPLTSLCNPQASAHFDHTIEQAIFEAFKNFEIKEKNRFH